MTATYSQRRATQRREFDARLERLRDADKFAADLATWRAARIASRIGVAS